MKRNFQILVVLVACFIGSVSFGQTEFNEDVSAFRPTFSAQKTGALAAKKDSVVEEVAVPEKHKNEKVAKMQKLFSEYYGSIETIRGLRTLIYSGSSESKANSYAAEARIMIPSNVSVYVDYDVPDFKVKVGDFVDRLEAFRLYHELQKRFTGALLVPDKEVKFKKLP